MSNFKKIIIFSVVFILIISGVIFVIKFGHSHKNIFRIFNKSQNRQISINKKISTEKIKEREEALSDYELAEEAREKNNIKYCYQLKKDSPDSCLFQVALYNNRKELCQKISGQTIKNNCLERFKLNQILLGDDINKCFQLNSKNLKNQCRKDFFWRLSNLKQCSSLAGNDKKLCEDIINNKKAYKENNIKICQLIGDEKFRLDCKEAVKNKPKDSDGDGLLDTEEKSYGTNLFKADTDGDGLLDGEEVKKGFNPNGAGKL